MITTVRVKNAKEKGPGTPLEVDLQAGIQKLIERIKQLENIHESTDIELFCDNGDPLTADLLSAIESNSIIRYNEIQTDDILEIEKQRYEKQSDAFQSLAELYSGWKTDKGIDVMNIQSNVPQFVSLPELSHKPAYFEARDRFVVRDCVLQLFRGIEEWNQQSTEQSGSYIAGPEGVGKSTALYFLSCIAMALHWYVIYLPRCDEWIAMSCTELNTIHYFAECAAAGIAPFRGSTKSTWQLMLSNVVQATDVSVAKQRLMDFIEDLQRYDGRDYPILLVFDEAHALHSAPVQWNGLAARETFPFNIAATFNTVLFQRGFKLISGRFESPIRSFMNPMASVPVQRLVPYSFNEFTCLLDTSLCPRLVREALKQYPSEKELLVRKVIRVTGSVPQQLLVMKQFEEKNDNLNRESVKDAFTELLEIHERQMVALYLERHTGYIALLGAEEKMHFLDAVLRVLLGEPGPMMDFSPPYLDRSLIYKRDDDTFDILTPAAAKAISYVFKQETELAEKLLSTYREKVLDNTASIDLRLRSLKQLVFAKIIRASFKVTTNDGKVLYLHADNVARLNEGLIRPLEVPSCATLFVSKDRPIALHNDDPDDDLNEDEIRRKLQRQLHEHRLSYTDLCITEHDI